MRSILRPLLLVVAVLNLSFAVTLFNRPGDGSSLEREALAANSTRILHDLSLTERVGRLVESQYVDPTRVKPQEMLEKALDQVEREMPSVLFEYDRPRGVVTVYVGEDVQKVEVGPVQTVDDVTKGLRLVLGYVGDHWPDDEKLKPEDVEYAAINGQLSTLDPHSVLLPPEKAKDMDVQIQGQFGGLGISISLRGDANQLTVVSVLEGTPAAREGLKVGDEILQIDGESTVNIDLEEAVGKLRGPVGSKVEILMNRKTFETPQTFTLRRDLIKIESVESGDLGDKIGYVKIKTFQHNTYQQLSAALSSLKAGAGGDLNGLVIDLRNNPGGPLQQAIEVSDRFVEAGTIVSTVQSYTRHKEVEYARRAGTEEFYPIVVIVDSNAASASEIVAGALKNNDRAVVIGETSFGKGSVQNLFPNPDDSKLKLTMLQYLTPGDQSIQSVGITPDVRLVPVYFDEEMAYLYSTAHIFRERDLDSHLDGDEKDQVEQDPPLATVRYFAPEEFRLPSEKKKQEENKDKELDIPVKRQPMEDFQVRFAHKLLKEAGRATRAATLAQLGPMLKTAVAEQESILAERAKGVGLDWSAGPHGTGGVEVSLTTEGTAVAGAEMKLNVSVTNRGVDPLYRVRAITKADLGLFNQVEFLFGKLAPGETRQWSRSLHLPESMMAVAEPVDVQVYDGSEVQLTTSRTTLRVDNLPHPDFAYTALVVEDGSGTSRGNGDGLLQKGEGVDLLLMVKNTGDGPSRRAFMKVHNNEGSSVFLKTGTSNLPVLQPGEWSTARLHFELRGDIEDGTIDLDLRSGDITNLLSPDAPLKLAITPGVGAPVKVETGWVKVKDGTEVRAWGAENAPYFARVGGGSVLEKTGSLGAWTRVKMPLREGEVVSGWVQAKATSPASAAGTVQITPHFEHWAPSLKVEIASYQIPQTETSIQLTGSALDDHGVETLFAFVNGKKRYFKKVTRVATPPGQEVVKTSLQFSLPMDEGVNFIEVYARDGEDLQAAEVFRVYRVPAEKTAQTQP